MRRAWVIAAALVVVAVGFAGMVGVLVTPVLGNDLGGPAGASAADAFRFEGDASGVHPYISAEEAGPGYGPMNLLVRGNVSTLRGVLAGPMGDWNASEPADAGDAGPGAFVPDDVDLGAGDVVWGDAPGSRRYACVYENVTAAAEASGAGSSGGLGCEWVLPDAQLHDGTYFGARVHLRLYGSPAADEPWVALQAHSEVFDWFTLRHQVDGVERAQAHVERDLMGHPAVTELHRGFLGNGGSYDADGWATVVHLAAVPVAGAVAAPLRRAWESLPEVDRRRLRAAWARVTPRHAALAASVAGILLGVRAAGVLLEHHAPWLSVHGIAAVLYPLVAVGIPAAAFVVARGLERRMDAGLAASLGLGAAVLVDYAALGVTVLPLPIVLQRTGVVLAVGLVAAGATERARREGTATSLLGVGLLAWAGLLVATLLQWI